MIEDKKSLKDVLILSSADNDMLVQLMRGSRFQNLMINKTGYGCESECITADWFSMTQRVLLSVLVCNISYNKSNMDTGSWRLSTLNL